MEEFFIKILFSTHGSQEIFHSRFPFGLLAAFAAAACLLFAFFGLEASTSCQLIEDVPSGPGCVFLLLLDDQSLIAVILELSTCPAAKLLGAFHADRK